MGLLVINGTVDVNSYGNSALSSLYNGINNNPNTLVFIGSGSSNAYATTSGNSSVMSVSLNPAYNSNSGTLANTLMHELVHVQDIGSGNFNFSDPTRKNVDMVEDHAEGVANKNFPRDNMCRK
jgi:hypothetical protein